MLEPCSWCGAEANYWCGEWASCDQHHGIMRFAMWEPNIGEIRFAASPAERAWAWLRYWPYRVGVWVIPASWVLEEVWRARIAIHVYGECRWLGARSEGHA